MKSKKRERSEIPVVEEAEVIQNMATKKPCRFGVRCKNAKCGYAHPAGFKGNYNVISTSITKHSSSLDNDKAKAKKLECKESICNNFVNYTNNYTVDPEKALNILFIVDCGASSHIVSNKGLLQNVCKIEETGDG